MIDWLVVLQILLFVVGFAAGFLCGMIFLDHDNKKRQKAKELEVKQQQMWTEYLEALRGGQNAK